MMHDGKSRWRHETLGDLTVVGALLADAGLGNKKKEAVGKWLDELGLLIVYEDLILGKGMKKYGERVDVVELLDMLCVMSGGREGLKADGKSRMEVSADRNVLRDALSQLFRWLRGRKIPFRVRIDEGRRELVFALGRKASVLSGLIASRGPLWKSLGAEDFFGLLAVALLRESGANVGVGKDQLSIRFTGKGGQ